MRNVRHWLLVLSALLTPTVAPLLLRAQSEVPREERDDARPFWSAMSWEELVGMKSAEEAECEECEEEEYNVERNPYWSALDPVAYSRAMAYTAAMPSEDQVEANDRGRALSGGRSWVGIGPRGGAALPSDPNRFWQGRIRCIRWWRTPSTGSWTAVIGASSGGLYYLYRRSPSPGYRWHWRSLGLKLPNPSVGAVLVHPTRFNEMLVGTGDWNRYTGAGLYRTTDGGESWTPVPLIGAFSADTVVPQAITGLEYRTRADGSADTTTLYLSSSSGFFRSTDGGRNWRRSAVSPANPGASVYSMVVRPTNGDTLWAGIPQGPGGGWLGVFRSVNAGQTWSAQNTGLPTNGGRSLALAISQSNPRILCASLTTPAATNRMMDSSAGIFRSTDGGANWTRIGPSVAFRGYMGIGQGFHTNTVAIHPTNPSIIYAASVAMIKTTSTGGTWEEIDGGHADYQFVSFYPTNPDSLFIGNDGGAFVRNEVTKTVQNGEPDFFYGNSPLQSYGFDVGGNNTGFAIGGTQDNGNVRLLSLNYHTSDGVIGRWGEYMGCDGGDDIAIDPNDHRRSFSNQWCGGDGLRTRTLNGGDNVEGIDNGLKGIWMTPLRLTKGSARVLPITVDTANVWFSTNNGTNWQELVAGVRDFGPNEPVRRMAVSPSVDGTFAVYLALWDDGATARNESPRIKVLEVSESVLTGGASFYTITTRFLPDSQPLHEVIVDRWDARRAWALADPIGALPQRIFETTDRGATWRNVTGTLPRGINYWDVQRRPDNPNVLYLSSDIGVFKTRNGGSTWYPLRQGLPVVGVNRMVYVPSVTGDRLLDTLRISTFGYGYWDRLLDQDDPVWFSVYPGIANVRFDDSLLRRLVVRGITGGLQGGMGRGNVMVGIADSGRLIATQNGGRSWTIPAQSDKWEINGIAARDCTAFSAVGNNGLILQIDSLNGGVRGVITPTTAHLRTLFFLNKLNGWAVGDGGTVLSTTDGGETWEMKRGGGQWPFEEIHTVSFIDSKQGIATGLDISQQLPTPLLLRTTDGGQNWLYPDQAPSTVPTLKLSMLDAQNGYGLDETGPMKTANGGGSWERLDVPTQQQIHSVLFLTPDSGWVAGDKGAMLVTGDGGKTWEEETVEYEGNIAALAASESSLVAVGDSTLLLRAPIVLPGGGGRIPTDTSTTLGVAESEHGVAGIAVGVPHPTPFSTSMEMSLTLAERSLLRIDVFDALGRPIRTLHEGVLEPGEHSVLWNGTNDAGGILPGGVYTVVVRSAYGSVTRRTVLTR